MHGPQMTGKASEVFDSQYQEEVLPFQGRLLFGNQDHYREPMENRDGTEDRFQRDAQ